jgi:prevent-host-death family protein
VAIFGGMSTHSVADAKNHLSELINRALKGEGVVITRRGQPVVELKAIRSAVERVDEAPRQMTEADFEWLRARRAKMTPSKTDAVTLIRQMRDEGEE